MTINEIMLRDMAEEERKHKQSECDERCAGDECGLPWPAVAAWLAVALAALGAAFTGGMCYHSRCALKASRDLAAWYERVKREATESARAMSNAELLQPVPPKETSR